jgi:hypothetical protein
MSAIADELATRDRLKRLLSASPARGSSPRSSQAVLVKDDMIGERARAGEPNCERRNYWLRRLLLNNRSLKSVAA